MSWGSGYPTWVIHTLTGKTQVVEGDLELTGTIVRVYQTNTDTAETRTEFVAVLENLDFIVRDNEND